MIKDAVSPLEPRYEDLAGDGLGRKARRHFLATRPKFLTASVLPVLVGTAWGATVAGFSASTKINRKDWELTWNVALETGGMLVGDAININVEVEIIKEEAAVPA